MDLMQIVSLGGIGLALAYMGYQVYMRQTALGAKQAENNKDNTPKWLEFAGQTLKGFDTVLKALENFSTRFESDSREREVIAHEQVKLLSTLSETVKALNARIDAESAAIRQGHAENLARLDSLTTIATAAVATAADALKEVQTMSDETRTRAQLQADEQQRQHTHLVETLKAHGLKLEQIDRVVGNADMLKEGALDKIITRLTEAVSPEVVKAMLKALADAQPPAPPTAPVTVVNAPNVVTNDSPTTPIKPQEENKPDDQP